MIESQHIDPAEFGALYASCADAAIVRKGDRQPPPIVPKVRDAASWILREHPELGHAVLQPAAHGVQVEPRELNASFRERFGTTTRGLVGPIPSQGDCLMPHIAAGRHNFWVDPSLEPRSGDLVLVQAGARTIADLLAAAAEDPDWCDKYAHGVADVWVKQLAWDGGRWLMVERSGAWPLGDCRALGVVGFVRPASRIALHFAGAVTVAPTYNIDARGASQELVSRLPAILENNNRRVEARISDLMRRGRLPS